MQRPTPPPPSIMRAFRMTMTLTRNLHCDGISKISFLLLSLYASTLDLGRRSWTIMIGLCTHAIGALPWGDVLILSKNNTEGEQLLSICTREGGVVYKI